MSVLRSARGQASIDWIVVVGVVTAALAVAGAAVGAPAIAGVVVRQFDRALCIVSRGDCNEDRAPCTTASKTDIEESSLTLAVVKVSSSKTMLVERRSDGTYRVTYTDDQGLGLDAGLGAGFSFSGLGLKLAIGGEARASVLAHLGHGSTWVAHSPRELALDEAYLALGSQPPGRPLQRFSQHGTLVSASGSISVPEGTLGLSIAHDDIDGTRIDAAGNTTTYLRSRLDPDASLQFGPTPFGVSLGGMKSTEYGVTADPTGRPTDLEIVRVGRLAAGAGLPGITQAAAVRPGWRVSAGDAWEDETHLDLSDPDNLVAARAFVAAQHDPGDLGRAVIAQRALAARIAVDGVEQQRFYDLHQSGWGISAGAALGVKVGGSHKQTTVKLKLVGARVRGPDGIWTRRDDCLGTQRPVDSRKT